jgi:predicted transposase/invertase (TIGR01784 family)
VEKSAMTEGQLYAYERFWMSITDERILREAAVKKSYNEGMEKGHIEEKLENAKNLKNNGVSIDLIAKSLGLSPEEIEHL